MYSGLDSLQIQDEYLKLPSEISSITPANPAYLSVAEETKKATATINTAIIMFELGGKSFRRLILSRFATLNRTKLYTRNFIRRLYKSACISNCVAT